MRAYFAILKDSYREAAASMVLWVALGGIALLLLILAPVGIGSASNTKLRFQELVDPEKFVKAIYDGRDKSNSPEGHFWSLLRTDQQEIFKQLAEDKNVQNARGSDADGARFIVVMTINPLLTRRDFYKAEAFERSGLDAELVAPEPVTAPAAEYAHRNLMRLEKAFSKYISIKDQSAMNLTYLGFVVWELPFLPEDKSTYVELGIRTVLYWFMGFVGVFASLLFTGALVPRMFEPGEISLLLSKPVHRCSVFVTKFIGGCTFTLICATFLVTGIWFLLGTRFGEWRHGLLWSIPLYVFLFSVYFSVSALAGAIWRNAIVSLAIVIVFWIGLSGLWLANLMLTATQVQARQFVEVSAQSEQIFAVDGSRTVHSWNTETGDWIAVSDENSDRNGGPAWFRQQTHVATASDGDHVFVFRQLVEPNGNPGSAMFLTGKATEQWELQLSATPPDVAFTLAVCKNGDAVFAGKRGIYRHVGQTEQERKFHQFTRGIFGASTKAYEELSGTDFITIESNAAVAFNPADESFVAFSEGKVWRIARTPDSKYVPGTPRELSVTQGKRSAILAVGGNLLILGVGQKIIVLDSQDLTTIAESAVSDGEILSQAEVAPDGSSATVLTMAGTTVVFDGKRRSFSTWTPKENGYASTIAYNHRSQLIVVDSHRSATIYDVTNQTTVGRLRGSVGVLRYLYDYGVSPVHSILPKPEEVDRAVAWLVSSEKSNSEDSGATAARDDSSQQETFDVRKAILSNLAFIVVMLGLGCLYIARSDF